MHLARADPVNYVLFLRSVNRDIIGGPEIEVENVAMLYTSTSYDIQNPVLTVAEYHPYGSYTTHAIDSCRP